MNKISQWYNNQTTQIQNKITSHLRYTLALGLWCDVENGPFFQRRFHIYDSITPHLDKDTALENQVWEKDIDDEDT